MDDGIMIHLGVVGPHGQIGRRLALRSFSGRGEGQFFLQIGFGIAGDRIVGRMGPRESDLQEQGFGLRVGAEPPAGHVPDEKVGVQFLGQFPFEGAETLPVVGPLAVEFALLLDQAAGAQGLVPLVEKVPGLQVAVLVFDYIALVKSHAGVKGQVCILPMLTHWYPASARDSIQVGGQVSAFFRPRWHGDSCR